MGKKVYWPSWRYHPSCPEGRIFQKPEDVPEGWVSHLKDYVEPAPQGKPLTPGVTVSKPAGKATKADKLLAEKRKEAEELGFEVPPEATIEDIQKALDEHYSQQPNPAGVP